MKQITHIAANNFIEKDNSKEQQEHFDIIQYAKEKEYSFFKEDEWFIILDIQEDHIKIVLFFIAEEHRGKGFSWKVINQLNDKYNLPIKMKGKADYLISMNCTYDKKEDIFTWQGNK